MVKIPEQEAGEPFTCPLSNDHRSPLLYGAPSAGGHQREADVGSGADEGAGKDQGIVLSED